MPILDASQLRKIVADRTLFDDVTLTIRRGEKVGLVGNNGAGKSTLARLLAGLEEPDAGTIARRRESSVDSQERDACGEGMRIAVYGGSIQHQGWGDARGRDGLLEVQRQLFGEELTRDQRRIDPAEAIEGHLAQAGPH